MPKLKPQTQALRRDHILDAAERQFARHGFHRTTMADICRSADISLGALYVHFDSKEALIEGLCERDRRDLAERLSELATAPDFISAIKALGQTCFVDEPAHKRLFAIEMGVEATRNQRVAEIYHKTDRFCLESFEQLFSDLAAAGRIAPGMDAAKTAGLFQLIGAGLMWRRAVHPDFNFADIRDGLLTLIIRLVNPQGPDTAAAFAADLETPAHMATTTTDQEVAS